MPGKKKGKKNRPIIKIEDERCFGEYRCPNCKRTWMSSNSWDKFGQKCNACNEDFVLPYNQRPLKPDGMNRSNPKKQHPRELCQKCTLLGKYCAGPDENKRRRKRA